MLVFCDLAVGNLVEPQVLSLELLDYVPQEQYSLHEARLTAHVCEAPNCVIC